MADETDKVLQILDNLLGRTDDSEVGAIEYTYGIAARLPITLLESSLDTISAVAPKRNWRRKQHAVPIF